MAKSNLIRFTTCLGAVFFLAQCGSPSGGTGTGGSTTAGTGGSTTAGTGGSITAGTGGSTTAGTGGSTTAGTGGSTTAGTGGSTTAGTGGRGGTTVNTGGTTGTGGRGGTTVNTGGTTGTGGAPGTGGAAARVDCKGQPLAKRGDMTTTSRAYLNLGDIRLINNRWGSDELGAGCGTTQRVFINTDGTLGWEFNRPICGGMKTKPDYPELEFGVAPFGANNVLLTSPSCSSTTVLPKQIKDITSATARVNGMNITLSKPTVWNISFELWLSQRNPVTDLNPGVVAEIIVFWGWEDGRWACDKTGTAPAGTGTNSYRMCHQSDTWANGQWRYYQFNVDNGPLRSYSGTVDAKALIDWVVTTYGLSRDLWVTRFEVGSEIDDNTAGSVKVNNVTFEVNGTSKSVELAP